MAIPSHRQKCSLISLKENKNFEIKVGVLNGKVVDLEGIKALSSLPSREVLLAQVLSTMNAVPTSLVTA
jgi:large subunit ribosomal protein L10